MVFAENTAVPAERSVEEIKKLFRGVGATEFMSIDREGFTGLGVIVPWTEDKAVTIPLRFVHEVPPAPKFKKRYGKSVELTPGEREEHRRQHVKVWWRGVGLLVKGLLNAAQEGIVDFREAFLPFIVVGNETMGQLAIKQLDTGKMDLDQIFGPQRKSLPQHEE